MTWFKEKSIIQLSCPYNPLNILQQHTVFVAPLIFGCRPKYETHPLGASYPQILSNRIFFRIPKKKLKLLIIYPSLLCVPPPVQPEDLLSKIKEFCAYTRPCVCIRFHMRAYKRIEAASTICLIYIYIEKEISFIPFNGIKVCSAWE